MKLRNIYIIIILIIILINYYSEILEKKQLKHINFVLQEDNNELYINPHLLNNDIQPNIVKKYLDNKINIINNYPNKNIYDNVINSTNNNVNKNSLMHFINFLI
jgi:hypothetical protein